MSRTDKSLETESKPVVAGTGNSSGRMGSDYVMGTVFLFEAMKMFWN